jgi:glycosyltransferase involved in cell wall biosynthesis
MLAGVPPIASVVIPAHDEEAVIGRTLDALYGGSVPGEVDVVVVANNCRDRTADIAADHGARVVRTPIGGKSHALRLGDAECLTYPRIYLDADVTLSCDSLRQLVRALAQPGVIAAAPTPLWDLDGASWAARRINTVHDALMAPSRALAGVGVYALSREGHDRIFPIPDVISDDELVHRSFARDERAVVPDARSVVRPARTVRAHLSRRVRVRLGNQQLDALGKPAAAGRLRLKSLVGLMTDRTVGPLDAACYLAVLAADRVIARTARRRELSWSSDRTTREVAATGAP